MNVQNPHVFMTHDTFSGVLRMQNNTLHVDTPQGDVLPVKPALSCLVVPQDNDTVLAARIANTVYVLSVLDRPDRTAPVVISTEADRTLHITQDHIRMTAKHHELNAQSLQIRAKDGMFSFGILTVMADMLKKLCQKENTVTKDSVRIVHGSDVQKAGLVTQTVTSAWTLNSAVTLIEADQDVRINAKRITMG